MHTCSCRKSFFFTLTRSLLTASIVIYTQGDSFVAEIWEIILNARSVRNIDCILPDMGLITSNVINYYYTIAYPITITIILHIRITLL